MALEKSGAFFCYNIFMRFNERLKELRIEKQLSQQELADLVSTGQSSISAWERGAREPLAHQLIDLARVFDCSVDYLLGISDIK